GFALEEMIFLVDEWSFLLDPFKSDNGSRPRVGESHHFSPDVAVQVVGRGLLLDFIASERDHFAARMQVPASSDAYGSFLIGIHFAPGGGPALPGQDAGHIAITGFSFSGLADGRHGFVQENDIWSRFVEVALELTRRCSLYPARKRGGICR